MIKKYPWVKIEWTGFPEDRILYFEGHIFVVVSKLKVTCGHLGHLMSLMWASAEVYFWKNRCIADCARFMGVRTNLFKKVFVLSRLILCRFLNFCFVFILSYFPWPNHSETEWNFGHDHVSETRDLIIQYNLHAHLAVSFNGI